MKDFFDSLIRIIQSFFNWKVKRENDKMLLFNLMSELDSSYQQVLIADYDSYYVNSKEKEQAIQQFKMISEKIKHYLMVKYKVTPRQSQLNIRGEYGGEYYVNINIYGREQAQEDLRRKRQKNNNEKIVKANNRNLGLVLDILNQLEKNIGDVLRRQDDKTSKYLVSPIYTGAQLSFNNYLNVIKEIIELV